MEQRGDPVSLDLHSLRREFAGPPSLPEKTPRPPVEEERSLADRAVDFLIPLMIFAMMLSVTWFLLDIRFVFTERLDLNMRVFAFFFVMGIVALNRLRADRGAMDSAVYFVGMIFAVGVFTVASQLKGGGMAGGVMTSMALSLCFNISVVAILWKITDRLTRDCCVDETARAGEVGLLKGGWLRRRVAVETPEAMETAQGRPPRRHPASSLFYLAIPIMILLAIGQRLLPQGGSLMESAGSVYVGVYTAAMLLLLMLSSYRGFRVYCQGRSIAFPTSIAAFWLGLGGLMVALVFILGLWGPVPAKPNAWAAPQRLLAAKGRTISTKYDYHEYQRESEERAEQGQLGSPGPEGREGQSHDARQPGQPESGRPTESGERQEQGGAGDGQDPRRPAGQQGQQGSGNAQGGEGRPSGSEPGEARDGGDPNGDGGLTQSETDGQQQPTSAENNGEQSTSQESSGASSAPPSTQIPMNELLDAAPALKWLAYGALALVGLFFLYFLIHSAAHYLGKAAGKRGRRAGLFDRLARFFRRLTYVPRRKPRRPRVKIDRAIATCALYHNPLQGQGSLREKIQYSYDAFCALAYDLGVPREEGQTPFEFLERLPEPIEEMRVEAHALTHLYVAGSYSTLHIPEEAAAELGKFWVRFERLRGRVVR